jgi:hypothetical protein
MFHDTDGTSIGVLNKQNFHTRYVRQNSAQQYVDKVGFCFGFGFSVVSFVHSLLSFDAGFSFVKVLLCFVTFYLQVYAPRMFSISKK